MRTYNEEAHKAKKTDIMERSFACYAENGFSSVGIKAIAKACDCSVAQAYVSGLYSPQIQGIRSEVL